MDNEKEFRLHEENLRLRKLLRESYRKSNQFEDEAQRAFSLSQEDFSPPEWIGSLDLEDPYDGIPTLFLSDWHWGEVVSPDQIQFQNEFNLKIAEKRARICFEQFSRIWSSHQQGCVVLLGGDMVSGTIHEELLLTNDDDILPVVMDCAEKITSGLLYLLSHFAEIVVFCVIGNHGRSTQKGRFKGRIRTNYDWLAYALCKKYFEGDDRIQIEVSTGTDSYYSVLGTRYLLTHGDLLGGGSEPILGSLAGVSRGDQKLRLRQQMVGKPYDVLVYGHYHQLRMTPKRICNGNLKGPDEFSWNLGFAPEPPQQASWLTHPIHGVTLMAPIQCQD